MNSRKTPLELLQECEDFEWDIHNYYKNWLKHGIKAEEAQQIFTNRPLLLDLDPKHSQSENRFLGYGQTNSGERLFVCYTIRNKRVRVISARKMSKKERERYEQEVKKNTSFR